MYFKMLLHTIIFKKNYKLKTALKKIFDFPVGQFVTFNLYPNKNLFMQTHKKYVAWHIKSETTLHSSAKQEYMKQWMVTTIMYNNNGISVYVTNKGKTNKSSAKTPKIQQWKIERNHRCFPSPIFPQLQTNFLPCLFGSSVFSVFIFVFFRKRHILHEVQILI